MRQDARDDRLNEGVQSITHAFPKRYRSVRLIDCDAGDTEHPTVDVLVRLSVPADRFSHRWLALEMQELGDHLCGDEKPKRTWHEWGVSVAKRLCEWIKQHQRQERL